MTVACPTGTLPFGGGALSSSGSVLVHLNSSGPSSSGWRAYENSSTTISTSLTPYVACGKVLV